MKKFTIQLAIVFCVSSIFAQWVPVNNGLPEYPPTSIINWVDTVVVSTYGGGIYLTYDQGDNWSEIPGTLPNLFVNKIEYRGGQFDPIAVSTEGGPFICVNGGYIDCNGTGLTNTSVNFWSGCGEDWDLVKDAIVGSNGDGIFAADYTSPFIYDWALSNAGISGNGLFVNDGLVGETIALLATEGGFYKAVFGDTEWSAKNNGLSGDALKINNFTYLGYIIFIATDGGLYYTLDFGEIWDAVFPDEKFNVSFYINTDISPSGFMFYAFGETGYYSEDFITWNQMDFGSMEGEVTAAAADEENVYIGFTIEGKDGKDSGGLYKKPIEQFIVGAKENHLKTNNIQLYQNFPNPFKRTTKINYSISNPGFVSIKIYNVLGNEIQTLVNKFQISGNHSITFNANQLNEGVYFYSLQVENKTLETKRMIIR